MDSEGLLVPAKLCVCQRGRQKRRWIFLNVRKIWMYSLTVEQKQCLIQQDDKRLFGTWHEIHFLQEPGMKTKVIMTKMPTSM